MEEVFTGILGLQWGQGGAGTVPGGQQVARGVHRTRGRINCRQRSPTHTKLTNTNLARSEALKELELPTLGLITSHSGWTGRGGRGRGRRGRRVGHPVRQLLGDWLGLVEWWSGAPPLGLWWWFQWPSWWEGGALLLLALTLSTGQSQV